jgi:hypothetical protein
MSDKNESTRDAFGFSLKGLRTAASYTTMIAVADDGINKAWAEKFDRAKKSQASEDSAVSAANGRFWLSRRYWST